MITAATGSRDISSYPAPAVSLARMFYDRVAATPRAEAFRFPAGSGWASVTWAQTAETVEMIAAGLLALGIQPEDRVAIASATRVEWLYADLAIMCAGAATMTVYPSTGAEDIAFIISDSGPTASGIQGRKPGLAVRAQHAPVDRLVLSKVRQALGGRIRFLLSGSAALSEDIATWFHAAGLLVLEGYGLTETSAAACMVLPRDPAFGVAGPPLAGTEIKIAASHLALSRRGAAPGRPGRSDEPRPSGRGVNPARARRARSGRHRDQLPASRAPAGQPAAGRAVGSVSRPGGRVHHAYRRAHPGLARPDPVGGRP